MTLSISTTPSRIALAPGPDSPPQPAADAPPTDRPQVGLQLAQHFSPTLERELVENYVVALKDKLNGSQPGRITVPPQTQLGHWLELYVSHLEQPVVERWMRTQNIDTTTLSVVPSTGALSAEVNGVLKTFVPTDTSGWGQICAPLLKAGQIIAPSPNQALKLGFASGTVNVPLSVVTNFYGEALPTRPSQARDQITRLTRNKTFDPIAPDDSLRPAGKRSLQALEQLKRSADSFYTTAPQALAYKQLAVDVANSLPNVRAEAKKWAEDLMFKLTGTRVDADTVYLNRFNSSQSATTATGWEHMNEEPTSSLRLPDVLLKNFSEADWVPGDLDSAAGLYKDGPGKSKKGGYGAHNQFPLAPSALMHASWKTDFQKQMSEKIETFWNTHGDAYRTALKGEFTQQARQQLKAHEAKIPAERALQAPEHQFTRDDYRLVMGAVSNLPLDENTPLTVAQLQAQAPAKGIVRAHAFDINGFRSNDIVRFTAQDDGEYKYINGRRDGTQILYIPGAKPAFLRFESLEKMDQWVVDQAKDPKKREALAAHFLLSDRQDNNGPGFLQGLAEGLVPGLSLLHKHRPEEGVDTALNNLATGQWDRLEGTKIDRGNFAITGDVFRDMTSATQHRMRSDADVAIKSNSEVTRDTWLNDVTVAAGLLAKLAPIAAPVAAAAVLTGLTELALGAEKNASGDTQAERRDGASKAFDGLLNTLFSVDASGSVEDPFIPPEEIPARPSETPVLSQKPDVRTPRTLPEINRLQPSQAGNISAHAVVDGEQLLARATPNAKGIYQLKDSTGTDQWLIRYTDKTGIAKVYEIRGDFKLSDNYVQIIDRDTRKPVMTVYSSGNGEWIPANGKGGIKWPWERTPSPTPSNDLKTSPKLSDGFEILGDPKTSGADKFDELFKDSSNTAYQQSVSNFEEAGVLKRKLTVSWTVEENNFEVFSSEKAQPNEHSGTSYSPNFLKDLNRDRYTVRIKQPEGYTTVELDATGSADGETLRKRLQQFEDAIPDPDLRSRISEVAHQGSVAPTSVELKINQLQDHVGFKGKDTHYSIIYDPATNEAQVSFDAQMTLLDLDQDAAVIPNVETVAQRTFLIRESNELEEEANPYTIDKSAPFTLSTSVITDLK